MSELVNAHRNRKDVRWQLLATVSAIALIGFSYETNAARADDDSDRPQFWIELGGQLSRLNDGQEAFAPAFPNSPPRPSMFTPSQKFERLPLYNIDETGKISFQPDGSDWVLSASVRYGRSSSNKNVRQQTHPEAFKKYLTSFGVPITRINTPTAAKFADTNAQSNVQHLVVDFQAGKDVGLGMFGGKDGSSVLNLGVRFAQFGAKSSISLKSNPDWHFSYKYNSAFKPTYHTSKFVVGQIFHSNAATLRASRSFHGIGPSISWNASAPFAGNSKDGELTFDWGVNAAILFGRQKAKVHHQATEQYHGFHAATYNPYTKVTYQPPADITRAHTVTVPNVGGFAGATWRIENFKVSAGYRADLFFNAMDGGIDAAKKENVGFYGPFATVSMGLGG